MADQSNLFRAQACKLATIAASMQDVARAYGDSAVASSDLELFQKRVEQFKNALHDMYWAFHSASFDVRNAERDAERATRKACPIDAGGDQDGTTVTWGGTTFRMRAGADVTTKGDELYVDGALAGRRGPLGNGIRMTGTLGNVRIGGISLG